MIKAFIDTNVLIDLLLERDGCQDAATILLCQRAEMFFVFVIIDYGKYCIYS